MKFTKEEIEKHFKENYKEKNYRKPRSINICEKLYKDFHKIAIDQGESMSRIVRRMMTEYVMQNEKQD